VLGVLGQSVGSDGREPVYIVEGNEEVCICEYRVALNRVLDFWALLCQSGVLERGLSNRTLALALLDRS
jgi:hypothetical protein